MAVSLLAWLSGILLGYALLRRWLGYSSAFLAAVLLVTSPLGLGLSRRALQDTVFATAVIGTLWAFDRCCSSGSRLWHLILLGCFVFAGLFTRESMVLLYPCLILLAVYYFMSGCRGLSPRLLIPLILAPVIYLAVLAWLAGDLRTLLDTYGFYSRLHDPLTADRNSYTMQYQQGPWFRYLIDFMLLAPAAYGLSLIGLGTPTPAGINRNGKALSAILLLAGTALFSMLPILNVRTVLFLDLPLRTLTTIAILYLAAKLRFRFAALVLLLVVATLDLLQFHRLFVVQNLYDPVSAMLLQNNGFVK